MRSPTDDGVDRPDLDAPQGVKATGTNRPKQTHTHSFSSVETTNTNKDKKHTVACVHYTVSDTTHATRHQIASCVCRWPIAAGKRPDPFRTRKLSLLTLMVLQPGGCGRVRNRRHQTTNNNSIQPFRALDNTMSRALKAFSNPHETKPHHLWVNGQRILKLQTRKYRPASRNQTQARAC